MLGSYALNGYRSSSYYLTPSPKTECRDAVVSLSTYIVFVFLSEAASVSSLLCFLAAYSIMPTYRVKWLKLASPLLIAGVVTYAMWNQPSQTLQGLSVFMSVLIFSFSMLIALKLAHILALDKARSLRKTSHARGKFDPKVPLTTLDRVVTWTAGVAIPAVFSPLAFLPAPLAAPVTIVGLVILLSTVFWRFGRQTSKTTLDVRFREDLRCLLILCLTLCGLVSLILFWWMFGILTIKIEVAFVLFSAFCACLVLALLGFLRIPKQFGGTSQDPHRVAFLTSYWGFEKLMAFSLLVFIFVFSDVPVILLLYLTDTTAYAVIWVAGVVGLLASLVKSYTFQRTSLMIESNQISRAQVDAAIVRLATSYLAS